MRRRVALTHNDLQFVLADMQRSAPMFKGDSDSAWFLREIVSRLAQLLDHPAGRELVSFQLLPDRAKRLGLDVLPSASFIITLRNTQQQNQPANLDIPSNIDGLFLQLGSSRAQVGIIRQPGGRPRHFITKYRLVSCSTHTWEPFERYVTCKWGPAASRASTLFERALRVDPCNMRRNYEHTAEVNTRWQAEWQVVFLEVLNHFQWIAKAG